MKPSFEELRKICPDVPDALIRAHLERLADDYFGVFSLERIKDHLYCLARLSHDHPVEVLFEEMAGGEATCTVLACDYPSEFSLITGMLSATGFNILSGNIFTYAHLPAAEKSSLKRRMIIDRFSGVIQAGQTIDSWKTEFKTAVEEVIGYLEKDPGAGQSRARSAVNEMVAARLAALELPAASVLYPVGIEVSDAGNYTRLRVLSQDTPAFLYALSSALAFQDLSIEQVRIGTAEGRVQDEIDILDARGEKINDARRIDTIKLSILLTKQFTYFLGSSPDPYAALCRFEKMLESVLAIPDRREWIELLSKPDALQGLARLLGASDFMWEDFIRLQYETLLPILRSSAGTGAFAASPEEFARELNARIGRAKTLEEKCGILNECKDRELFLIDLDQILNPTGEVKAFSVALTRLAETVVRSAAGIIFAELEKSFGVPRTVAGMEAQWAIFGLGKFGGEAIGYASDIELLLVFSDNGRTDGRQSMENSEYFSKAARMLTEIIRAKREGIFHVDMRLRPYGESGPMACSLDSFCRYYGPKGKAHSYERLALVRLRAVSGNGELGGKIERLRDEFIYGAAQIKLEELRELREKQIAAKVAGGRYNAKFSPGALVDLEYDIQLLQVMHGHQSAGLRTPRIHEALSALSEAGILGRDEGHRLAAAYYFFRRLINGLRMLRGSARDLFLPPENALEFVHLARRMGYQRGGQLEPRQQLRVDFETQTAVVRAFVERHFGRDSLPGKPAGNVVDLILSGSVPPVLREKILAAIGFKNTERAYLNLRALGGDPARQDLFAPLAVLVCDSLKQSVDPDRALNNWERYVRTAGDAMLHFELLLAQPRRIEILLGIFAASQFLADTLIGNPEFFSWATAPGTINRLRPRAEMENELRSYTTGQSHAEWLDAIRRFRHREILRIGTRDIFLHAPIREVTADLSSLAEAMVRVALEHFCLESGLQAEVTNRFCILSFGKLGGRELNYSSDIDLLGVYDVDQSSSAENEAGRVFAEFSEAPTLLCQGFGGFSSPSSPWQATGDSAKENKLADSDLSYRMMGQVGQYLSIHTAAGHAYRVDFRLRPYGQAGQVAYSLPALMAYYRNKAALWEVQALLKARPVAGSEKLGERFLDMAGNIMRENKECKAIAASIENMRGAAIKSGGEGGRIDADIKNGSGGIRDIEFLAQGLQLANCPAIPELISGNTLEALTLLGRHNLLPADTVESLKSDYEFLRRVEHCLQIFEDQQVHVLPDSDEERLALAKRVLGAGSSAAELLDAMASCQARVRNCFKTYLACNA